MIISAPDMLGVR